MAYKPYLKGPSSEVGQARECSSNLLEHQHPTLEQPSGAGPTVGRTLGKGLQQVPSIESDLSTRASCTSWQEEGPSASHPASYSDTPRLPAVVDSDLSADSVVGNAANAADERSKGHRRWLQCLVPCLTRPQPLEREIAVYGVHDLLHRIAIKDNATVGELILLAMMKDGQWPPKRRLDRGRLQSFDGKKFDAEMKVAELPLGVELRLVIRNLGDMASAKCDCNLAGPCDNCQDRFVEVSTSTRVHYSSNHESISACSSTSSS